MVTGYAHPMYALSLAEFGEPRELQRCGGWILERQIPGFPYKDAMGCYPLFCCRDWSRLHEDLEDLKGDLVSLALVADPFGDYDLAYLRRCFDFVKPFKEHFVANLRLPINGIVSKHHRYYAQKAQQCVQIEVCSDPKSQLDGWAELYATLIDRHKITGIRAFSKKSFARQLAVPGVTFFKGIHNGMTVGANLIYVQRDVAYSHLSAFSPIGYKLRAAYAIRLVITEHLRDNGVIWLDHGASAGLATGGQNGLSRFKKGWATETKKSCFCGRIFDREKYSGIVQKMEIQETDYFPAYRMGEFA